MGEVNERTMDGRMGELGTHRGSFGRLKKIRRALFPNTKIRCQQKKFSEGGGQAGALTRKKKSTVGKKVGGTGLYGGWGFGGEEMWDGWKTKSAKKERGLVSNLGKALQ